MTCLKVEICYDGDAIDPNRGAKSTAVTLSSCGSVINGAVLCVDHTLTVLSRDAVANALSSCDHVTDLEYKFISRLNPSSAPNHMMRSWASIERSSEKGGCAVTLHVIVTRHESGICAP